MKKDFILALLIVSSLSVCSCQSPKRELKIHSITAYIDGFVITGISLGNKDTITIASIHDSEKATRSGLKRIIVGNTYVFEIDDIAENIAAIPPENFTIRLKTTVIWNHQDGRKKLPVFAKNVKGIFIQE